MKDLHSLPKVRDSWSYLYVERCRVDQQDKAIAFHDQRGVVPVPCASLTFLMLGPGTTVTHAAMRALAENGCTVAWTGEGGVRFYAQGTGETRSARNLLRQAQSASDATARLAVIDRMYRMRFKEELPDGLDLAQIRGKEGLRVRASYASASRETGVSWQGRSYRPDRWGGGDPINRALSAASSCLYGVCHAAIVSAGYSPAIGFVHTGKMLSFVYDIADLYKADITIPAAFRAVGESDQNVESRVRQACRDLFYKERILQRIVPDIDRALGIPPQSAEALELEGTDGNVMTPGWLWDPGGEVAGGINRADLGDSPEVDVGDMEP
jgi:CRISPR-associated protein Cas1